MNPEFSRYQRHARSVRKLVDLNDLEVCTKFYGHLGIPFEPHFSKAVKLCRELSKSRHAVVATTLIFSKDVHAVSVWMDKGNYRGYLFDSNGYFDPTLHRGKLIPWESYENLGWVFNLGFPKVRGPQQDCPLTPGFIHGGGYCEFYNYMAIRELYDPECTSILARIMNPRRWYIPEDIGQESLEIVRETFKI